MAVLLMSSSLGSEVALFYNSGRSLDLVGRGKQQLVDRIFV